MSNCATNYRAEGNTDGGFIFDGSQNPSLLYAARGDRFGAFYTVGVALKEFTMTGGMITESADLVNFVEYPVNVQSGRIVDIAAGPGDPAQSVYLLIRGEVDMAFERWEFDILHLARDGSMISCTPVFGAPQDFYEAANLHYDFERDVLVLVQNWTEEE